MNSATQLPIVIRSATANDAAAITDIYNHYVTTSIVSFEEQAVTVDALLERMGLESEATLPWLVAEHQESQSVVGFAYGSVWRARSAYRHTVEVSIYNKPDSVASGVGSQLYTALFESLRSRSVRMLIATIALPNNASIALHEKFGMTKAAHYPEVGFKFDRWVDIGVWQGRLSDVPHTAE